MSSIIHTSNPKIALLSYVHNEPFFFPIWMKHYSSIFAPDDIYVINNNSTDGSFEEVQKQYKFNEIKFKTEYNHDFYKLFNFLDKKIEELFLKYKAIYIAECDEILFHPKGLIEAGKEYLKNRLKTVRCLAYEPIQIYYGRYGYSEPSIDLNKPLLKQRKYWRDAPYMRKCVFISENIPVYRSMHDFDIIYPIADMSLIMLHIKFIDFEYLWQRNLKTIEEGNFSPKTVETNFGFHNRTDMQTFNNMFLYNILMSEEIPERYKNLI